MQYAQEVDYARMQVSEEYTYTIAVTVAAYAGYYTTMYRVFPIVGPNCRGNRKY